MSKRYDRHGLGNLIFDQLKASEYWTNKTRVSGSTIQGLTCPACGDSSAWAYKESPMAINCNRLSQCGARTKTLELFDIRQDFDRDYKPTKSNPNLPATEYLKSRGLNNSLKGLDYVYWRDVRKTGSGAVMFPIRKDANGKQVMNGRLFNPPPGEGKTHNSGSTAGLYWQHPGVEYTHEKPLYITEGIFDALSLLELGHQAIAVLAAGQDPARVDLGRFPGYSLMFAYDADQAGARATKKWKQQYQNAEAIMPDLGSDWNDLLCSGPLEKVQQRFMENKAKYQVNAALALAESARKYADIYYEFHGQAPGLFTHNGSTFFAGLKTKGDNTTVTLDRLGMFTLQVVAYFWDTSIPYNHECRYQLEVKPVGGQPVIITASGKDLATQRNLKELLLTRAKVSFEGGTQAATALSTMVATSKAPEVTSLPLTGYDNQSGWFVFAYTAIDHTGKIYRPDQRGFYKINHTKWAQPPAHATDKAIDPAATGRPIKEIYQLIFESWGHRGTACLAWAVGSWFVTKIKEKIGFYPFLSMFGDVQAAKTSLAVVLNQLQGFDTEGITASTLNTKKGLVRSIGRVSNLFSAIVEGNQREDRAGFDHSSILPLYNRNALMVSAKFTTDNQTVEMPFAGALSFVANNEVFAGKAEKERVISIEFKTDHLTTATRKAHDQLCKIPLPELARTIVLTLHHRQIFESGWYDAFLLASNDLAAVRNRRIRENHALVLAFHRLFCKVHGIKNCRLQPYIEKVAKRKEITSAEREHTVVEDLFEKIDKIKEENLASCLYTDEETENVYLYLPGIEQNLRQIGFQFSANKQLFDALQQHPAFIKSGFAFRFPNDPDTDLNGRPKLRKTWVFSAKKMQA